MGGRRRRWLLGGYVAHATVSIIGASPVLRYVYRPPQVARVSKVSKDTVGGVLRLLLPLQPDVPTDVDALRCFLVPV